ncbi:MAG: cob(I)yrinic acid a,c-diamide adenosyltransferase [Lachnospiraceae bacterium]|nr:cob(I)yrinic acid a,c-diamide adenosyltransferase [Lachnospiraceae bacterium]
MEKGLTHLYYGDGKGKTTAAIGLCIRAAGNKKRVLFAQFMKDGASGEISLLREMPGIDVLCGNVPYGFYSKMDEETKKLFAEEQEKLLDAIIEEVEHENQNIEAHNGKVTEESSVKNEIRMLLVLDEITYAYNWSLIDRAKLENLINNRPDFLEIVMTGRNPEKFLMDAADYVTEMKCEKHPFEKGIQARKGVEF